MHVVLRRCSTLLTEAWDWFKAGTWTLLILAIAVLASSFALATAGYAVAIGGAFLGPYVLAVAERNFNYKVDR